MLTAETVTSQEEVLFDFSIVAKNVHRFKLTKDDTSRYRLYVNGKYKCYSYENAMSDLEAIAEGLKDVSTICLAIRDANKEIEEATDKPAHYLPSSVAV